MRRVICIVGPTASGKTALSVALAQALDGEVVSCDSMQVYRGMDIGTAKATTAERRGVVHHMLDVADPSEEFSVSRFVSQADPIVQDILVRGKTPVLAGGSGLYIDALVRGNSFAPCPSTGCRAALEEMAERDGTAAVSAFLATFDPDAAARLPLGDRKRIIRAAEVYLETGRTITEHNTRTRSQPPRYQAIWIGLTFRNRQDLYDRIDRRVEAMFEGGLLEEVRRLLQRGVPRSATSLQAIGYKEVVQTLLGQCTEAEAMAQVQKASRNYAKRQLTWFRRNPEIFWIEQPQNPQLDDIFFAASRHISFFDTR